MFKSSPRRNQRTKGFKVKHALQLCVLLGVCIWLIYQVKHSHEKKGEYKNHVKTGSDVLKLGRKDLRPIVEETITRDETLKEDEEEDSKPNENVRTISGEEESHNHFSDKTEQGTDHGSGEKEDGKEQSNEETENENSQEEMKEDSNDDTNTKENDDGDSLNEDAQQDVKEGNKENENEHNYQSSRSVGEKTKKTQESKDHMSDENGNIEKSLKKKIEGDGEGSSDMENKGHGIEHHSNDDNNGENKEEREKNYNGDDASSALVHQHHIVVHGEKEHGKPEENDESETKKKSESEVTVQLNGSQGAEENQNDQPKTKEKNNSEVNEQINGSQGVDEIDNDAQNDKKAFEEVANNGSSSSSKVEVGGNETTKHESSTTEETQRDQVDSNSNFGHTSLHNAEENTQNQAETFTQHADVNSQDRVEISYGSSSEEEKVSMNKAPPKQIEKLDTYNSQQPDSTIPENGESTNQQSSVNDNSWEQYEIPNNHVPRIRNSDAIGSEKDGLSSSHMDENEDVGQKEQDDSLQSQEQSTTSNTNNDAKAHQGSSKLLNTKANSAYSNGADYNTSVRQKEQVLFGSGDRNKNKENNFVYSHVKEDNKSKKDGVSHNGDKNVIDRNIGENDSNENKNKGETQTEKVTSVGSDARQNDDDNGNGNNGASEGQEVNSSGSSTVNQHEHNESSSESNSGIEEIQSVSVDSSSSSVSQEEKEARTDLSTLPQTRNEDVDIAHSAAAE
ncbi:unnamed protein product [Linum trigynum]|uniref:Uncharacterized protein n=1 Tax=Linum trigynum TaxID=586398 RepID=A0AAV2E591_9ROSI